MENKDNMETMVSVLKKVEASGYVTQFRVTENGLHSQLTHRDYQPSQVKVEHFYRFEGASTQDDEAILYAIDAAGEKGTLVNGYGASGDDDVADFMRKVDGIHK